MKNASSIHALVVVALLGLSSVPALALDRLPDADASYTRAGALYDAGMKEMESGQLEAAIGKLKSAQTLIEKISKSQPGWQPALVAYRLQKIENVLKELSLAQARQHEAVHAAKKVVAAP